MANAASHQRMSENIGLLLNDSLKKTFVEQMVIEVIQLKSQILLTKQGSCILVALLFLSSKTE